MEISHDLARLDFQATSDLLKASYWGGQRTDEVNRRAFQNSVCAIALIDGRQVGFARVVTDRATFAYLCDVYVLDAHRGRGLATWMIETLLAHPDLQGLRRFMLFTRDAHALYRGHGFAPLATPQRGMEIVRPGLYLQPTPSP